MKPSFPATLLCLLCIGAVVDQAFGLQCYGSCKVVLDESAYDSGLVDKCTSGTCGKTYNKFTECRDGYDQCRKTVNAITGTIYYGCGKEGPFSCQEKGAQCCKDGDFCVGGFDKGEAKKCGGSGGGGSGSGGGDGDPENGAMGKRSSWILVLGVVVTLGGILQASMGFLLAN